MIKLTYSHNRNIDNIYFEGGWEGTLYFDTVPKGNGVKYISDVEQKNGIDIVKSKIVQEEHIIRVIVSEPMTRVLQKIPLCNDVRITVDDFEENKVYNFTFEIINWIGGGAYAQVKMTYAIHTFVNKNATISTYE